MTPALRCLVLRAGLSLMAYGLFVVGSSEAQAQNNYENLKVLPADISRRELGDIMLANLSGLGLPRLAGEGCLFCHEGDLETPRRVWDYASDTKPMKAKARVMLAMVRAINNEYLPHLESRVDADLRVTCETCHAGRTDPRPLPTVLWAAYELRFSKPTMNGSSTTTYQSRAWRSSGRTPTDQSGHSRSWRSGCRSTPITIEHGSCWSISGVGNVYDCGD